MMYCCISLEKKALVQILPNLNLITMTDDVPTLNKIFVVSNCYKMYKIIVLDMGNQNMHWR
jgi:hypothetical protein